MAEIAHAYAERTAALTNATTTFASAVSLAAGAFTAGKKYLLWVTAQTGCNSTASAYRPELVVAHGSTDFEDSRYYYKLDTADNRTPYAWFHVWTAVDGEGVDLKFRTGNVSATASIDQANILAVCLSDDLIEGTDWHYSEDGTDSGLISITTPLDGASITFTPPSGGKDWLVVALAQIKATNSGVSMGSRLSRTGEATQLHPEIILEPTEANNVLDQLISPCVFQLGAVSQTFKQQSLSYGSTDQHYRWHSRVFAINLSKFRSSAFAYTQDATAGDFTTTPWSTEAQTLAFTPDIEGPCWVGAYTTFDKANLNANVGFRLQVDDADAPATQTADAYTFYRGRDSRDEDGLHIQALPTLTAAAHTAALDVYAPVSASGSQTAKYRLLWAVSMELATPTASLDLDPAALALAGAISVSGDIQIGTSFDLSASPVALAGALAVSGDIQITEAPELDLDPAALALSGALAISGDIQIGTSFDLAADPVALSGSLAVSGDIESSVDPILDIDAAPVALAGSLGISGDIQIGTSFDLAASAVALAGSLSVSGEIQSSTEPIIVARGRTSGGGLELFIDEAIEDDDEVIEIMQVLVAAGVLWEV